jgi:hypothetical protein
MVLNYTYFAISEGSSKRTFLESVGVRWPPHRRRGLRRLLRSGTFWGHTRDKLLILTIRLNMVTMFQGKIQDGGLDDDGMLLSAAKLAG